MRNGLRGRSRTIWAVTLTEAGRWRPKQAYLTGSPRATTSSLRRGATKLAYTVSPAGWLFSGWNGLAMRFSTTGNGNGRGRGWCQVFLSKAAAEIGFRTVGP